jgi:hypothetical protein
MVHAAPVANGAGGGDLIYLVRHRDNWREPVFKDDQARLVPIAEMDLSPNRHTVVTQLKLCGCLSRVILRA